jgi:tetratricopeptide (TPR) repeat protein
MTWQFQGPKSLALGAGYRSIASRTYVAILIAGLSLAVVIVASFRWLAEPRAAADARRAFLGGRYDQAEEALVRWLGATPDASEAHLLKGRVAVANAKLAIAIEELTRARTLGHRRDELAVLEALIASKAGRNNEAEPTLRKVFESNPRTDRQVNEALAKAYLETYDLTRAANVLDRWARDFPDDPKPFLWRAEIHSRTGGDAGAIENDYREALRRDPSLARAHLGLADELRKAHRNDEAAVEYDAYLAAVPNDAAAHLGAARNLREGGDQSAADAHLERVEALDGNNAELFKERADAAIQRRDWGVAIAALDRAVKLAPDDVAVRHSRALVLASLGRAEEARSEQSAAIGLRKDLDRLREARTRLIASPKDRPSQLEIARWMFDHGHEQEGIRWAVKILADWPGDAAASRLLTDYYERHGDPGLANFYRVTAANEHGASATSGHGERE